MSDLIVIPFWPLAGEVALRANTTTFNVDIFSTVIFYYDFCSKVSDIIQNRFRNRKAVWVFNALPLGCFFRKYFPQPDAYNSSLDFSLLQEPSVSSEFFVFVSAKQLKELPKALVDRAVFSVLMKEDSPDVVDAVANQIKHLNIRARIVLLTNERSELFLLYAKKEGIIIVRDGGDSSNS